MDKPLVHPRGFTLTDNTGTPQVSPISSAGTEVALKWPTLAVRLNVYLPTQAGELRTVAGGATGGKATIPAASWFSIPGKGGDITYIGRPNGNTTLEFAFEIIVMGKIS